MSAVTRARWFTPRQRTVSSSVVMSPTLRLHRRGRPLPARVAVSVEEVRQPRAGAARAHPGVPLVAEAVLPAILRHREEPRVLGDLAGVGAHGSELPFAPVADGDR